ncbi:hypothetical protein [Streptomyces tendae]|uniref:hypothetical protein n=1 Tax=Streptomyces tendae TaxID=1932 RepID=UPI0036A2D8A4
MRNGEAFTVNLNNIVADDVYRITEQVNRTTCQYERLKHRKAGEYRDVPALRCLSRSPPRLGDHQRRRGAGLFPRETSGA